MSDKMMRGVGSHRFYNQKYHGNVDFYHGNRNNASSPKGIYGISPSDNQNNWHNGNSLGTSPSFRSPNVAGGRQRSISVSDTDDNWRK